VGAGSRYGARLVRQIAEAATRNGRERGGMTMLKSFDEYINMAKLEGLTYFDMPTEVYQALKQAPGDMVWEVNRQFLDQPIAAGHSFQVTLGGGKDFGKYLQGEMEHLTSNGYKFAEGVFMRP
jgi:hypothetical protein